jgi:hypothetical protein
VDARRLVPRTDAVLADGATERLPDDRRRLRPGAGLQPARGPTGR